MDISDLHRHIAELRDVEDIVRAATVTLRRSELELTVPYAPPSSDEELRLAEIWRSVLALDEAGLDDNFFELGGDSLQLMQMLSRIERAFGCELPVAAFVAHATIRGLAHALATHAAAGSLAGPAPPDAEPHDGG